MGNTEKFGIGHKEAASGVIARFALTFCTVFDLLVSLIAGVRSAAAKTGQLDRASRPSRQFYDAWSVQPRDRHGLFASNALPSVFGQFAKKSQNTDLGSTENYLSVIEKSVSVFFNKIVNIGLKQNNNSDHRGIFTSLSGRVPHSEGRSTNGTLLHVATGGSTSASCAEGYFIPT